MAVSKVLQDLLQKNFKENVQISRISEDLRGKVIVLYGGNNVGKTTQAAKFKNPIFLPVEKGLNATNGAISLKTTNWSDLKRNARKLASKDFVDFLKSGEQVTIVIDGIERIGTYCKNYLCAKYDVDTIGQANNGYGAWEEYDNLIWTWVDSIISLGYTVVFIGHEKMNKDKEKYVIYGDERNIRPIRDNADIVAYIKSNGIDENGKVILSSAYLAETNQFFARTRYTYMDTEVTPFTAENFEKIVVEGIKKQNKAEGFKSVSFEEQQKVYGKNEENYDDIIKELKNLYIKMKENDMVSDYAEIVQKHLGDDMKVSQTTSKQLDALLCIRDDIKEKLQNIKSTEGK